MPMYTYVFTVPSEFVSDKIIPLTEPQNITTDEDSAKVVIPPRQDLPVLRCGVCFALIAGDPESKGMHNDFHDFLRH